MAGINRSNLTTAPQGSNDSGRDGKGMGLIGARYKTSTGNWEPTVLYLVAFVILEILAYGWFRYFFRGVHGG